LFLIGEIGSIAVIMGYSIAKLVMKSFIGTVIVLGFFGPYMISIILGLLCLAVWAGCRYGTRSSAVVQEVKPPPRAGSRIAI
jgi:hypothetical protein